MKNYVEKLLFKILQNEGYDFIQSEIIGISIFIFLFCVNK